MQVSEVAYPGQTTQIVQRPVPVTLDTALPQRFSTVGQVSSSLTIASAVAIGSNMVDVRNGGMSLSQAVVNGVVKGAAATLIINNTTRNSTLGVVLAAGVLAGAGYVIDTVMKKSKYDLA